MLFDMENDNKSNILTFQENSKYQTIVEKYSTKLKKMREFTNKPIIIK